MESIALNVTDHIMTLTLNRPEKRNAMDNKMIKEMMVALDQAAADKNIRVLLINGQGENFCAGGDIAWMHEVAQGNYDDNYDDAKLLADLMFRLYSFNKPIIVLAHGVILGGGLGILSACDIVIAAQDAQFGFSEVKIGLAPSVISPYVVDAIGERLAYYYFLTGSRFNADEAHRIGLVHQLVDPDCLLATGITLAKQLLLNSPHALSAAKDIIRRVSKEKITNTLSKSTAEHLANLRASPEAQEGLQAFIEKRAPNWRGE